jgi:hypothetical protein
MSRNGYNGRVWEFENDSVLVRIDDKVFQKHLNAYLESRGIPTLSYPQLIEYTNYVLDQRCQAAQRLHDPESWRKCDEPGVQVVQLLYKLKR